MVTTYEHTFPGFIFTNGLIQEVPVRTDDRDTDHDRGKEISKARVDSINLFGSNGKAI